MNLLLYNTLHHTMMGRDMVKETTLNEYLKNPSSGNEPESMILIKEN